LPDIISSIRNEFCLLRYLTDDLSKPDQIDLKKQIRKITQESNVQQLTLELEYKDEDCELKDC